MSSRDSISSSGSLSSSDNSSFHLMLLVPIIGILVLLLVGGTCCCWMHRHWQKSRQSFDDLSNNYATIYFSPQKNHAMETSDAKTKQSARQTSGEETFHVRRVSQDAYELGMNSGPLFVWRMLQEDTLLASKRIPYAEIKLQAIVSKNHITEVRLAEFQNQRVVVKRMVESKQSHFFYVQEFIRQLQLRVELNHENIVTLTGVAWGSGLDILMVTEHYPSGDLLTYLQHYGEYLTWVGGKHQIAIDIVQALVYLHNQQTPVAHRNLRASNVLLTEKMQAKLTGFDSLSHSTSDPFWAAPEVLRGGPRTIKSDLYAFGVLLTELDTGKTPFHDANGTNFNPTEILNEVTQGTMQPSFSPNCPRCIRVIGFGCFQQDPSRRPTAEQLLRLLES